MTRKNTASGAGGTVVVLTSAGLAYGLGVALAARGSGDILAHLTVHLFLVVAAGVCLRLATTALRLRAPRPTLVAGIALALALSSEVFFRSHLLWMRGDPWLSMRHGLALAVSVLVACAVVIGSAFLPARLSSSERLRSPGKIPVAVCLVLCAAATVLTPIYVLGRHRPDVPGRRQEVELPYNVLILTVDTLRADHLSQYGYEVATSDALDRFGFTRFDHVVATSNWTKPSTASILTGTYPSTHTAVDFPDVLPEEAETILEILGRRGAVTGFCSGNVVASGVFGLDQGAHFSTGDPKRPPHALAGSTLGELLRRGTRQLQWSQNLNRYALGFLDRVWDRRFLLYVQYNDPHNPYDPPASMLDPAPDDFTGRSMKQPSIELEISEAERAELIRRYDGEVRNCASSVAKLLGELEARGVLDDTLVVLTADHGEAFHEHGHWMHGKGAYEEVISVPLLIRPPGGRARVPVVDSVCSQVDIVPTVLEYLGLELPEDLPGRSLVGWIEGTRDSQERAALMEGHHSGVWSYRRGDLKVIVNELPGRRGPRIYDLGDDPLEQRDLAAVPRYRTALRKLVREGSAMRAAQEASALRGVERAIDEDLDADLRALGYVR